MWPTCINNLTPFERTSSLELPEIFCEMFQLKGITNPAEMVLPVRVVALLGKCGTETYSDCPNLPEWHVENSQDGSWSPAEYFAEIGRYCWFDFDLADREQKLMQFRLVFNVGDGDCNDGNWGAVWDRIRNFWWQTC